MYVRAHDQISVQKWVDTVHDLRYKDYRLVAPVDAVAKHSANLSEEVTAKLGTLEEVATVKEMAAQMERQGLQRWWRVAMGFLHG